jgi:hypothetical protein
MDRSVLQPRLLLCLHGFRQFVLHAGEAWPARTAEQLQQDSRLTARLRILGAIDNPFRAQ